MYEQLKTLSDYNSKSRNLVIDTTYLVIYLDIYNNYIFWLMVRRPGRSKTYDHSITATKDCTLLEVSNWLFSEAVGPPACFQILNEFSEYWGHFKQFVVIANQLLGCVYAVLKLNNVCHKTSKPCLEEFKICDWCLDQWPPCIAKCVVINLIASCCCRRWLLTLTIKCIYIKRHWQKFLAFGISISWLFFYIKYSL